LVRGSIGTPTNAPVLVSRGLDCPAGGTAHSVFADAAVGGDAPYLTSAGVTVLWRGLIRTAGAFSAMAIKAAGNGGTNNPFDMRTNNATPPELHCVRATAAGPTETRTGGIIVVNRVDEYVYTFADNLCQTQGVAYQSGVFVGTTIEGPTTSGAVTGSGANLLMGRRGDGAVQLDGTTIHLAVWGRALSADQVQWFYAEPYAMLRPIVRRRYFVPAAVLRAGGGRGGDHTNRRQHRPHRHRPKPRHRHSPHAQHTMKG
jgi:hypothetical protein